MTKITNVFVVATISSFVAGAAAAQQSVFDDSPAETELSDLEETIEEDFERDVPTFGVEGRPLGFTGSVSARATAVTGNTETVDIGIGARLGFFDGLNGHRVTLSYAYSETDDGVTDTDRLYATYDYTREFAQNLYGFVKVQAEYNNATDLDEGAFEDDVFFGFGAGYRVFNTPDMQWSVQAGPGYRVASLRDVADDLDEAAISLSSYYFQRINPTVFVTNDTDIIFSESDTSVTNELGLNVSMTNQLALRTSVLTQYNSEPGDAENTDNTFGLSLVYSFN